MKDMLNEDLLWDFLNRHLNAIYSGDFEYYKNSCSEDLSLYEWFVSKHRIDGVDFHRFMMENNWADSHSGFNITLSNKRAQIYDNVAVLTYTLILSAKKDDSIFHRAVNETRVVALIDGELKVVHVHKSPAD